jgi:hypothetical protein
MSGSRPDAARPTSPSPAGSAAAAGARSRTCRRGADGGAQLERAVVVREVDAGALRADACRHPRDERAQQAREVALGTDRAVDLEQGQQVARASLHRLGSGREVGRQDLQRLALLVVGHDVERRLHAPLVLAAASQRQQRRGAVPFGERDGAGGVALQRGVALERGALDRGARPASSRSSAWTDTTLAPTTTAARRAPVASRTPWLAASTARSRSGALANAR